MDEETKKFLGTHISEAYDYSNGMSRYFYEVDTGQTNAKKPDCPKAVSEVIGCLD